MAEEGFLARWSRRKRGLEGDAGGTESLPDIPGPPVPCDVGAGAQAPDMTPPEAPVAVQVEAASALAEAEPPFDPASLPPVESLTAESDLAPFLRPRVPAALRQAALRRIWQLDPAIRDFIGPADYAWDYNSPGGVPGFDLELGEDVARRLLALLT
ncbi:MAG: DUF3306 domain-containing protein, partial [Acetobacteraceae bacterium]|nr:DUF3306 domain-containing protein [Acetobacteraceae bacterium]